jgi:hypothetical protein
MARLHENVHIMGILVILALMMIEPFAAAPQTIGTLQPGFGQVIVVLHRAESSEATSSEVSELVTLLNKALELNREALKLNAPDEVGRRAELLAQVDQILTTVENRSVELTVVSSQRAYRDKVFTYVGAAIVAVLGTIIYAFAVSLHQRYRIKRTFQMKVSLK